MASNSKSKLQTPQKPQFKSGSIVEVSSDDDGFRGSWYTAKVIKRASSKNHDKYLVEYQKLFDDDAGEKPLKEILDWAQLRPVAPREKKRKFRFGEKVDAYHNDGWWEGSITEERENGKFAVFFRGTREQIVFTEQDLRLHREWINGEWKPPLEDDVQVQKKQKIEEVVTAEEEIEEVVTVEDEDEDEDGEEEVVDEVRLPNKTGVKPNETVAEEFTKGMDVEVSSNEEGFEGAWFCATIIEAVGKDKYLVEYKALRTDDDTGFLREEAETECIRPCPPETIVVDRFKLLDEVDALYNDGWWVGVISKVLIDCKYVVYFRESQEELTFRHSDLRIHQDWIAGQWITPSLALTK